MQNEEKLFVALVEEKTPKNFRETLFYKNDSIKSMRKSKNLSVIVFPQRNMVGSVDFSITNKKNEEKKGRHKKRSTLRQKQRSLALSKLNIFLDYLFENKI